MFSEFFKNGEFYSKIGAGDCLKMIRHSSNKNSCWKKSEIEYIKNYADNKNFNIHIQGINIEFFRGPIDSMFDKYLKKLEDEWILFIDNNNCKYFICDQFEGLKKLLEENTLILEAQQRSFRGGNLFSNNHRYPNLPSNCTMVDIDNMVVDVNFNIIGILEDKHKFDSKTLGNPLSDIRTWQIKTLYKICNRAEIHLFLMEKITQKVYDVLPDKFEKIEYLDGKIIETDNIIYIEVRYGSPAAVIFRTGGNKDLKGNKILRLAKNIADRLGVDIYLVNDVLHHNKIYIKKLVPVDIRIQTGQIDYHQIIADNEDSWKEVYRKLNLI